MKEVICNVVCDTVAVVGKWGEINGVHGLWEEVGASPQTSGGLYGEVGEGEGVEDPESVGECGSTNQNICKFPDVGFVMQCVKICEGGDANEDEEDENV